MDNNLIEMIDKYLNQSHISMIDIEYGDNPINPAYLMREAKKVIKSLSRELKDLKEDYSNLFEEYKELDWRMKGLEK